MSKQTKTLRQLLEELTFLQEQLLVVDALIQYLRLFLPEEHLHQLGDKKNEISVDDFVLPKVAEETIDAVMSNLLQMSSTIKDSIFKLENGESDGTTEQTEAGEEGTNG